MKELSKSEIEFHPFSVDSFGKLFFWDNRLFRAISPESTEMFNTLMESGLLDKLTELNLFPSTNVAEYQIEGFGPIIEHKQVSVVTYPFEWSFSMYKDAALTLIRVNEVANQFGFQIKDGHGLNILFDGMQPKFVDLGSFIPFNKSDGTWKGFNEYLKFFYYPLRIWADGDEFLARQIIANCQYVPHLTYLRYRFRIMRYFPQRFSNKLERAFKLSQRSPEQIRTHFSGSSKGKFLAKLKEFAPWLSQQGKAFYLKRKTECLTLPNLDTQWGDYHDTLLDSSGIPKPTERFERIREHILKLGDIESVIELAGNQGSFSRFMLSADAIKQVICSDYDSLAVEKMYDLAKSDKNQISPVLMDITRPIRLSGTSSTHERFRSDVVIALAVTHHLLLTQGLDIDTMLQMFLKYSRGYIFVEFMPLGLYNGSTSLPMPDWYNIEWFREACQKHFVILEEEQLEPNRVLFIGKVEC